MTFFVEKIAPVEIDKTSGDVRRRLKKVFEDFYEIYKNPKNSFLIVGNNSEKDNKKIIR